MDETTGTTSGEVRELEAAEGAELLDRQARKYLGMSGDEFAAKWRAGELDPDADPAVMRVAMLLPLAG